MILKKHNFFVVTFFLVIFLFISNLVKAEEENSDNISTEIQKLKQDLKTLEKAVYKSSQITTSSNSSSNSLNEDILTRHLLKLNEIETQFQNLTNKFEEVNFKMDKLSKRITKMQTDNQMRFSDLENNQIEDILKEKLQHIDYKFFISMNKVNESKFCFTKTTFRDNPFIQKEFMKGADYETFITECNEYVKWFSRSHFNLIYYNHIYSFYNLQVLTYHHTYLFLILYTSQMI